MNMDKYLNKLKIHNMLAPVGAVLAILSFFFPWWKIYFVNEGGGIYVYPYTIDVGVVVPAFSIGSTTVRLVAFTLILIIAISLTLLGIFKKGWKGRSLLGIAGIMEIGIGYVFRQRIFERVRKISEEGVGMFRHIGKVPASGETTVSGARIVTDWEMGLTLIFAAGAITLISILLHDRFVS